MGIIKDNFLYQRNSLPLSAENYLERPHLYFLFENAIQKPLTTVIAGAGYGKTQAASTLYGLTGKTIIWIALSALDNHLARLWERLVYGFQSQNLKLADRLNALGFPENISVFNQFLSLLARELPSDKRFVLVLDDFHFIENKAVFGFVENFINANLQSFSIILISRTKPKLNLAGLFSKGLLARIDEDDLRFTKKEMAAYYGLQGLCPDAAMLEKIYNYTQGWIFAIFLVGLSMKKGNVHALNPIALAKGDIFELIDQEIFSPATDDLRVFLMRIALLDALPKGLMAQLSSSAHLLSEMMQPGQFIRYDALSDSYSIHQIFRDFLLEHNSLSDEQRTEVHMLAADWYRDNGFMLEAMDHYHRCNSYNEIFDIMIATNRRVGLDVADFFIRLINEAPSDLVQARPILYIVKAYCLLNNNRIDAAYNELKWLRQTCEGLAESAEYSALLGEAYILLALISIIHQNFEFEEYFKLADQCLPDGSSLVDHRYNIAEGINITGIKNPIPGELTRYVEALFRAMPHASRVMNGCNYGAEYLNAADACFMTGDIAGAKQNAYEAIARSRQKQQYGIECMANFILVRIFTMKGKYSEVATILKQMKQQLESPFLADSFALYEIIEGWFFVKIGETDKVKKWIRHEEETRKFLPPVVVGREYLVRSDSLLAEGRYDELLAFMGQTDLIYSERGILYAEIQNMITRAIIYHYSGESQAAVKTLNEAYRLSSPNNLVIQYIEYGNQMRTLLGAARRSEECDIPSAWLDKIITKSSTYAKQLTQVAADYKASLGIKNTDGVVLSKRETDILCYLCQGLTRKEMADACNLSVSSIKSILQSIYNKLGAVNSADAVRIAGLMGLNQFK